TVTVIDRHGKVLIRYPSGPRTFRVLLPPEPRPKSRFSEVPLPLAHDWTFQGEGLDGIWRLYAISQLGGRLASKPAPIITVGLPLAVVYAKADQSLVRNLLLL